MNEVKFNKILIKIGISEGWDGGRSKQVHGARCRVHGQHREMETNGWKIGMMELERWGRFPTDRLPYDGESA